MAEPEKKSTIQEIKKEQQTRFWFQVLAFICLVGLIVLDANLPDWELHFLGYVFVGGCAIGARPETILPFAKGGK